ncbi:MAG TPA: hypothetical protein VME22_01100 [Solirubrobacteraceae bacterium]|nr:hypothetical protein [Solirubrobacteraceae bacterium]
MVSRVSGRLVTGPLAFFLAGVVDVGLLLVAYARWRATQRVTRPS